MDEKHEKGSMRDRHWDRQADKDRDEDNEGKEPAPSGNLGPSGGALDSATGKGGPMAPDPPEDLG
jgi:hypothetical protein